MAEFFSTILNGLADFFITIINFLITGVATVLGWIVALFPNSPFKEPVNPPEGVMLGWLAWFFPFTTAIAHTALLATAILTYYAYRVLARWIKLARG